jgi:hypothetical protein
VHRLDLREYDYRWYRVGGPTQAFRQRRTET